MNKVVTAAVCASLVLSGCARSPGTISGTYISPLQYQSHSCSQLNQELSRINARATELAGRQSSEATKDAVALGAGLILFWPALFFMIGGDRSEELSRLKGEIEAVEQSAIQKNCTSVSSQIAQQRDAAEAHQKNPIPN
ncbi:MAG: hypothetical protein OXI87_23590 [Albidovulum sp.]|nr:hypothetical protein [Albidovulum sp.]MDE0533608.1 hypothetical protein [Albidovulum sp.]